MSQNTSLAHLFRSDPDTDWRSRAACKGVDPELFFSSDLVENKQEKDDREATAKAICLQCDSKEECLEYAIKAGERYGIWGGLSEQERRTLQRRRNAEARASRSV